MINDEKLFIKAVNGNLVNSTAVHKIVSRNKISARTIIFTLLKILLYIPKVFFKPFVYVLILFARLPKWIILKILQTLQTVFRRNVAPTKHIHLHSRVLTKDVPSPSVNSIQGDLFQPASIHVNQTDADIRLSKPVYDLIRDTLIEEFALLKTPATEFIASVSFSKKKNLTLLNRRKSKLNIQEIIKEFDLCLNEEQENINSIPSQNKINEQEALTILRKKLTAFVDSTMTKSQAAIQVRILTLNHQVNQESVLYRLQKEWTLQFRLGSTLSGRKIYLFCNYPINNDEFKRNRYHQLQWQSDVDGCGDDSMKFTNIKVKVAGSFHYYFTYDKSIDLDHQGSGYFTVNPTLTYGNTTNPETLPLDCIQCQTVLSKSLGKFDAWENRLRVSAESGYNMIHFTPIQELGISNSAYCLKDQLVLNPLFNMEHMEVNFSHVENLIKKIREKWKVTSICDIVLNHTANESPWLLDHPESSYNCQNCPYMRPAYLLDVALHLFSIDVGKGLYETKGIPADVETEEHLSSIRYALKTEVIPKIRFEEFFICDTQTIIAKFLEQARYTTPRTIENEGGKGDSKITEKKLRLIQNQEYNRLATIVDIDLATKIYNTYRNDCYDEDTRLKKCAKILKNDLDALNAAICEQLRDDLNVAVENCVANARYFRVRADGPRLRESMSAKHPLVERYYTDCRITPKSIEEAEIVAWDEDEGKFLMAHNGWLMDASDPMKNFAADSKVYLRRELIIWGDNVKLRYGFTPDNCPYLWQHMRNYVEQVARIFDGVRLDNCHSTPLPVAEYLLDCARLIRPDLYTVAELFTNSVRTDNVFVNRLGITSLIREAMSAWDSHELARLVYRYGDDPVGAFYPPPERPLQPSIAHASFLDQTHDNPSPIEKRSVYDLLPSTALVSMACCSSGSTRGYDELVPHHIHVVKESRFYKSWSSNESCASKESGCVSFKYGIIAAKRALNKLHFELGSKGYTQIYVDQIDPDIVAITRHNPTTHDSVVMVAYTAFTQPIKNGGDFSNLTQKYIKPLRIEGNLNEIILEAHLTHSSGKRIAKATEFVKDEIYINGYDEYVLQIKEHFALEHSTTFVKGHSSDENVLQLNFKQFKPGSIVAVKVTLKQSVQKNINDIKDLLENRSTSPTAQLKQIIDKMSLADLNRALYRCDQEENDEGNGFGTYDVPGYGRLVYCGFQGVASILARIRATNDLGHPLCANLRQGDWLAEYLARRLTFDEGTRALGEWIEIHILPCLKQVPRYLVPAYFDSIFTAIYILLLDRCFNAMNSFVRKGSSFIRALSLGSVQCAGYVKSSELPRLSPNLSPPVPLLNRHSQKCVSLSAGLPHFSIGYTRNWGRDTFISLRGLLLITGRYEEARWHILAYAGCLRHGLIPNLLDGGRNSRYNCRDAVWWWLYCIRSYSELVPNGVSILNDPVSRLFPQHDTDPPLEAGACEQSLCDVMQESLKVHFQGLSFRERNAGKKIDEHMNDRGFNNQIGVHPETGFVFGGNEFNCGTWMDKMGSSDKAGNRGTPATPRDGSAIELIGLSKSVITWLAQMNDSKNYPYDSVQRTQKNGTLITWTFKQWAQKIQDNFEKHFWIGDKSTDGPEIRPDLVNKRYIYKDCYGAGQPWTDYQLRCNFPIAMVVAPELFNPDHAWQALEIAKENILGPLGMKTLDPSDWNYRGNYDNANDSDDAKIAHGFNYHQGPEWLWPIGYFFRAQLIFAKRLDRINITTAFIRQRLARHSLEIESESDWRGLPELTNADGAKCPFSCETQAWSMGCILEVMHDLKSEFANQNFESEFASMSN